MIKYYLLFFCFIFSSCAHYFEKKHDDRFQINDYVVSTICIHIGEGSLRNNEKVFYLDESNKTHGKIVKKIKEKYPTIEYNCDSDKKVIINYHKVQEKTSSDFFILSLGIIPEIINVEYNLDVYSPNKGLIYQSSSKGKIVLSIFLVPFFFLHNWEYETIFEEIDKYLQEQSKK